MSDTNQLTKVFASFFKKKFFFEKKNQKAFVYAALMPGDSHEAVVSRTVKIVNRRGLHARAAARLVNAAEQFSASIDVVRDGQVVSAQSIMGLMMLGAGMGSVIELRAEGFDAHEALDAISALIEAGFHEQD